jgi:hypothetical protein
MRPYIVYSSRSCFSQPGCATGQQAQNSDPMLPRTEQDSKIHGEVAYGQARTELVDSPQRPLDDALESVA